MAVKERSNSEKRIDHDNFRLKIGTTNRNNPGVVYIHRKASICTNVEKETYNRDNYET